METVCKVLSFIGIFLLGLFVRSFFPSYMKKKGENLATKEDIEEITRIVEGTKNEYVKEVEEFKTVLLKEIQSYSEQIKLKTSDNYNKYINLYSKLYIVILQSEYMRNFLQIEKSVELVPFVELYSESFRMSFNGGGIEARREEVKDEITSLNKKFLIDTIFENVEYASEKLLKIASGYRYVHKYYLKEPDNPDLKERFQKEEVRLLNLLVRRIIIETNGLKKELNFDYNEEELICGEIALDETYDIDFSDNEKNCANQED